MGTSYPPRQSLLVQYIKMGRPPCSIRAEKQEASICPDSRKRMKQAIVKKTIPQGDARDRRHSSACAYFSLSCPAAIHLLRFLFFQEAGRKRCEWPYSLSSRLHPSSISSHDSCKPGLKPSLSSGIRDGGVAGEARRPLLILIPCSGYLHCSGWSFLGIWGFKGWVSRQNEIKTAVASYLVTVCDGIVCN